MDDRDRRLRWLERYAVISSTLALIFAVAAFSSASQKQRFTELDVERLNIVTPAGAPRLVISNRERAPDIVFSGKTFHRSGGNSAGMIFYNEEGDEDGGLGFSGQTRSGRVSAEGGLMFDQYKQDQTVGISYSDDNGRRSAGFHVWDRPNTPILEFAERVEAIKKMPEGPEKTRRMNAFRAEARARGDAGVERVMVGKNPDRSASLVLSDAQGRPRLRVAVDSAGEPRIEMLDATGRVTRHIPDD